MAELTILVIDDDPAVRSVVRRTLERVGYIVLEAENGAAGLTTAAARPIDLVITDIYMPDVDGIETIQRLREKDPTRLILAMSGGSDYARGSLEDARLLGADATLPKPFGPAQLRDAVAALLEARSPESEES